MEITWLGHSCFRIKGKKITLVTDPFDQALGYPSPGKLTADIVTVSHNHRGHNCVERVGGNPRVINGPGEYESANVFITGIRAFHDGEGGRSRGDNTIYLIEIDGLALCHLGDLGHMLSPQQIEELNHVDVLLIPVGGVSTINAPVAAGIVRLLEPGLVIPMHFQTEVTTWLEPVDGFLNEMGNGNPTPQPRLSVTKSNLLGETQVVRLDYPR
jgi:L-ascorbate metabolism protein UlaG (beta-lactamase superfamily)